MNKDAFITIPYFLRDKLDLKGSELIISALIYGFSQDGESWFTGSTEYICHWTGTEKKNVLRVLKSLVERDIIEKKEVTVNNIAKKCHYKFNIDIISGLQKDTRTGLQKDTRTGLQKDTRTGLQKDTQYNIDNDNIDNDIIVDDNIKGDNIGKGENEFSPEPARTEKRRFSKENGLTPGNLNVRQSTIDKIDAAFEQLIFPVDDVEVKRLYFILCCSPKWRGKTINALQMSLNKMQHYHRDYIKKLIEDSIAGGWQGIVFSDTEQKYKAWLKENGKDVKVDVQYTEEEIWKMFNE